VFDSVLWVNPSLASALTQASKLFNARVQAAAQHLGALSGWALLRPLAMLLVFGFAGCSPALNWRTVSLGDTTVTLPCKPDRAQRAVRLGDQSFEMEMVGCEAEGALYAVSRVRLASAADADSVRTLWQAASLQQIRGQSSAALLAPSARAQALRLNTTDAIGQARDGRPVSARLTWTVRASDLLHMAVYAPRLTPEMVEPFFDGIQSP
jgi:hypothetical protein